MNNESEIYVIAVNGEEPKRIPGYKKIFNSYLLPGVHKFTVQYSWVDFVPTPAGLIGLASSAEDVKDICFPVEGGKRYVINSTQKTDGQWTPEIYKSTGLLKPELVPLVDCN